MEVMYYKMFPGKTNMEIGTCDQEGSRAKGSCVVKPSWQLVQLPRGPQKTVQVTGQSVLLGTRALEYYPATISQCLRAAPEVT